MLSRIDWRSFFWALDYFSRSYVLALLLIGLWSTVIFLRVERRRWRRALADSQIARAARNLESLVGFSWFLARALFATQIVELCRYYFILRSTDADVVSMVDEAWLSTQLTIFVLLTLSAMHWRVCSVVAQAVAEPHAANSLK